MTINDMKNNCNDYFFSSITMRFFKGYKYKSVYLFEQNFIEVKTNYGETKYYMYDSKHKTNNIKELPKTIEELNEYMKSYEIED